MALQTDTSIYIARKKIGTFKNLKLKQEIANHHTLELVCRMDVLENLADELGNTSKNFLGEIITIEIAPSLNFNNYEKSFKFKGVVTQVKNKKGSMKSSGDFVVIIAKSPTYIADDGPNYASYNDVSLSEIIEATFHGYNSSLLKTKIAPKKNPTIHYSVQQNESTYAYAQRLAAQYGQWFYYNGTELVFGIPENEETKLTYGIDLKEYELNLQPKSYNYTYYTDDYLTDEIHEKDTKEIQANAGGYHDFVTKKASTIFNKETNVWLQTYNDSQVKKRLDNNVTLQKKAIEMQQVQINGISDNTGIKLGNIIVIEATNYRVTAIEHTNNETGDYINTFTAVTANFDAYPNTNIHAFPKSETQTAVVVENADPDGLSRVRVQFPWQEKISETTPWLRIVTPHAGGDKGFHFIPEINEEVLIGFEGGNAERPYVLGSLYNGNKKATSFKTENNDIKAIKTRSGHIIELNDTKGGEFISITDVNKNTITLNTVDKTISITAPEHIFLNSKNISLKAEKNINFEAGEMYQLKTKNYNSQISQNAIINVGEKLTESSKTHVNQTQEITIKASSKVAVQTPDFNHGV